MQVTHIISKVKPSPVDKDILIHKIDNNAVLICKVLSALIYCHCKTGKLYVAYRRTYHGGDDSTIYISG